MIILDTNVLSEVMKPRPDERVARWLSTIRDARLGTTSVTVAEIEYGLCRLPEGLRQRDLRQRFATLVARLIVLPLDDIAATYAGAFRAKRDLNGMPSTPSDMMIAGIVMQANASLATRNVIDFKFLPIDVINPWHKEAPLSP